MDYDSTQMTTRERERHQDDVQCKSNSKRRSLFTWFLSYLLVSPFTFVNTTNGGDMKAGGRNVGMAGRREAKKEERAK